MAFRRALILSSLSTTVHGASTVSVAKNILVDVLWCSCPICPKRPGQPEKVSTASAGPAALSEAAFLFFASDVQPELKENDAFREQVAFKGRHFFHEGFVLFFRAEAHNRFNNGAVVPGTVKEDHFTGRGQMRYVALEVPLTLLRFPLGLGSAAILAPLGLRCSVKRWMVPPLPAASRPSKIMTSFLAFLLDPRLKFQEFNLQTAELFVVKVTVVSVDIRDIHRA